MSREIKPIRVYYLTERDMEMIRENLDKGFAADKYIGFIANHIGCANGPTRKIPRTECRMIIHDCLVETISEFVTINREISKYSKKSFKIVLERKINQRVLSKETFEKVCAILEQEENEIQ